MLGIGTYYGIIVWSVIGVLLLLLIVAHSWIPLSWCIVLFTVLLVTLIMAWTYWSWSAVLFVGSGIALAGPANDQWVQAWIRRWYADYPLWWIRESTQGQIQDYHFLRTWDDPYWTLSPGCVYIVNYCNPSKNNFALKLFSGTSTVVLEAKYAASYYPDPTRLIPIYNRRGGRKSSSSELITRIQHALSVRAVVVMAELIGRDDKGEFQMLPFRTGIFRWIQQYHWTFCPLVICPATFSFSGAVLSTRFVFWQGPTLQWNSELTIDKVHRWMEARLAWMQRWSVS